MEAALEEVTSLWVSRAGTEKVNGYYKAEGTKDGVTYYKNTSNSLIIRRYHIPGQSRYWYLTDKRSSQHSSSGDYYRIKSTASTVPCDKKWDVDQCPEGKLPAPRFSPLPPDFTVDNSHPPPRKSILPLHTDLQIAQEPDLRECNMSDEQHFDAATSLVQMLDGWIQERKNNPTHALMLNTDGLSDKLMSVIQEVCNQQVIDRLSTTKPASSCPKLQSCQKRSVCQVTVDLNPSKRSRT